MQQRVADVEEELRRARDDVERARAEARVEINYASAREAAAVADRDAVWKALRTQLAEAAQARAAIETELAKTVAELVDAKAALERAETTTTMATAPEIAALRRDLELADRKKVELQRRVDELSNVVEDA